MGLDSIWDLDGNWLTKRSRGFRARSTGCSCCSTELDTEGKVKEEAIDSLRWVLKARDYFNWDFGKMVTKARKLGRK